MDRIRCKTIIIALVLQLIIGIKMSMTLSAAADNTILINVGQIRQILLGAPILTGKLVSGTWSSSNSSIASIVSQSPGFSNVLGVSAGSAIITCNYKYYIGGTYISSSWSCPVKVSKSGSEDVNSGYMQLYFLMTPQKPM